MYKNKSFGSVEHVIYGRESGSVPTGMILILEYHTFLSSFRVSSLHFDASEGQPAGGVGVLDLVGEFQRVAVLERVRHPDREFVGARFDAG